MRFLQSTWMLASIFILAQACAPGYKGYAPVVGPKDTAESNLGERIFRDFRFSKYFVDQSHGNANYQLPKGDPQLGSENGGYRGDLPNPFAHQAMSCVACHMVGDASSLDRAGMRAYTDFTQRSSIPSLADGLLTTPRNTPTMLGALTARDPFLLHFDGEFATIEDLIIGSYTGRNFGWMPGEESIAKANLIETLRADDGSGQLAQQFGKTSYRNLFLGSSPMLPAAGRIDRQYRMDIWAATDDEVLSRAVELVKVYLQALQFATDTEGLNTGSAYDQFLIKNKLPRKPEDGETEPAYADRLSLAFSGLARPVFVSGDAGTFGDKEFAGAKIFFARSKVAGQGGAAGFEVGNCIACHAPPNFTDYRFHNTGGAQDEYDSIHGAGMFAAITIPSYLERVANPNLYVPATDVHPHANSRFRTPPSLAHPENTDLGAWNIAFNSDFPASQPAFQKLFCVNETCATDADTSAALDKSIATVKTPTVRQLGMTDPYLHTGTQKTIPDVLRFYQRMSELSREGKVRNADPELLKVEIDAQGVDALSAFLNSLNEDYE